MNIQTGYETQEIKRYINQLPSGDVDAFEALVAYGEQAIPALLETLQAQADDEDMVFPILGILSQQVPSAVPVAAILNLLLGTESRNAIWAISIVVLAQANPSDLQAISTAIDEALTLIEPQTIPDLPRPMLDLDLNLIEVQISVEELREISDLPRPVACRRLKQWLIKNPGDFPGRRGIELFTNNFC